MIESSLPQSESVAPAPAGPGLRTARSVIGHGVAAALMLITPLVVFAPAALFHCAIRNGRRATWGAFLVAVVLAAIANAITVPFSGEAANVAWSAFAMFTLGVAAPAMAALPLVERGEAFGRVLLFTVAGSAIGLGITELGMQMTTGFSPYAFQVAQTEALMQRMVEFYQQHKIDMSGAKPYMGFIARVLPASILAQFSVFFVLSLMMIGRLAAWRTWSAQPKSAQPKGGTAPDGAYLFRNLSFPDWLLFGFVLGGLTPLVRGPLQAIAANVLALVVFLYILQGLAIFRSVLARAGAGPVGTIFGFLLLAMLVATGLGLLLLLVMGLFDPFFDFRNLKRKDDADEGHTD